MTIIKDIINLWKAEDLLSQAWTRSYEMMELSREIFNQAIKYLRRKENIETLKALKKRDREINAFQQEVRRKVLTHYAVEQDTTDMANGLILINMVVDIERIGDYCKNILDLAINHPDQIISEDISKDLNVIEMEVKDRFDKTIEAIHTQNA
ncbi:MAG: PhoU domain-containing protein, partial [Candidatus Marinimicrobia bacterium]|nr:PhoU domain-containing protein [Candidatus Neomarinimicrobiota bacterium]